MSSIPRLARFGTGRQALGTAAGLPEAQGTYGGILWSVRWQQGQLDEILDFFIGAGRHNCVDRDSALALGMR